MKRYVVTLRASLYPRVLVEAEDELEARARSRTASLPPLNESLALDGSSEWDDFDIDDDPVRVEVLDDVRSPNPEPSR